MNCFFVGIDFVCFFAGCFSYFSLFVLGLLLLTFTFIAGFCLWVRFGD